MDDGLVEQMYREYAADLTVALALSTGDREAAADLAHEVFVRALIHEERLRDHPDRRGWLFRTGYNLARNRWRLLGRQRHQIGREYAAVSTDAWDEALDLRDALRKLSRRQRDALTLHDYLGFSVSEAAGILDCAEGTVWSHLHRGRGALRRLLGVRVEAKER